jgi:hypothetical protein
MFRNAEGRNGYDARTAITFLLAGLGLGALTALLVSPRPRPEALTPTHAGELTATSMFP